MKIGKKLAVALAVAAMGLAIVGCGGEQKKAEAPKAEKGKWVVAINATFPPFESIDKKDAKKFVGVDIDIANYLANKMNKTVEFQDMKFASLVPTLQAGRANIIISGISPTKKRQEVIDFSKPYYFPQNALICKKGANFNSLDSLAGKKAGASLGTTYAKVLASTKKIEVVELNNTPLVIQDILAGRLEAGLFDAAQAVEFIKQNEGKLEMHTIKSEVGMDDVFAIGVKKGDKDLPEINKHLAEMRKNGELHKILAKHLGEEATKQYEATAYQLEIAKQ